MFLQGTRSFYCACLFLLVSGALPVSLSAQKPKVFAPHRPLGPRIEKRLPWGKPTVRQSATGGLWMTDAKWKSTLNLTNGLKADPITVTPVLYLSNGQRYSLSPVTMEPSGTAIVDIGQALGSVGIAPYATLDGYAEIEYQWPWAAVSATVKNVNVVSSLIYIFGLQPSPDWKPEHKESFPKTLSTSFEGLWWAHEKGVSGFLALSNVTARAIHATVRLTDHGDAQLATYQVTVSPHGTKMVTLDALNTATDGTGGVYLTHDGAERGLDINGGLQGEAVGYSAHLPMRPQPQPSSTSQPEPPTSIRISQLGLMAGSADPMMGFPSGTVFTPYSLVRNISDQPAVVTPELWWMAGGSPQSATLPQITVPPHHTVNLNAPALLAAAGLKSFNGSVNLILDTQAQNGGLLMSSGSVDQSNTYVFEVMSHGVAEGAAKELCYWSTGNGDETMLTLWNPADEAQDLAFTLFYSGGQYVYPIHLGPRETRTLNVSQILHSSIPDAAGNVVPAGISEGSAEIAGALAEHQHILISLDVAVYNVRKATCGTVCWECDGVVSAAIALTPFGVGVGTATAETFYETWNTGSQHGASASWHSSATSIATVNGSGAVTGVKAGSLTLSASDLYTETDGVGWYCTDIYFSCPTSSFSGSSPGKVTDNTPILTGISPSDWTSGTTTLSVTFTGQYFGTNAPTLSFSPSTGISYSLVSYNDTQIRANVTVASGTPNEYVTVTVKNNGYGGLGFQSGGGSVSATSSPVNATIHAPITSPEVTVIAWVNGNAPDLVTLPSGANTTLIANLNNSGASCSIEVFTWSFLRIGKDLSTQNDRDYANAWLIKHSANTAPPSSITPNTQQTGGNYRLFNDFGNSKGSYNVGNTPDPCKWLNGTVSGWLATGEASKNMGRSGTSGSGKVYQIAEGRIGKVGQLGSQTINQGRTVPFIYDVIEFDSAGNPTVSDHATFPTYYFYINGVLQPGLTVTQSTVKAFVTGYDATNENAWSPVP